MTNIAGTSLMTLPVWLLAALADSAPHLAIAGLRGLYGGLRFLHLAGMAGFVGMVAMLDLRGLGLFPPGSLDGVRGRLGLVLQGCFWVTVATGVALFLYDPMTIGLHSMFLPKLVLVTLGYAHARVVQRLPAVRRRAVLRRGAAGLSLAIWLLVIGASTWNHVERPAALAEAGPVSALRLD